MEITPLPSVDVEEFAVKVSMQVLKEDRELFYTSLVAGIERMKHDVPTQSEFDSMGISQAIYVSNDIACNQALDDIIEKVVKPLYGKE